VASSLPGLALCGAIAAASLALGRIDALAAWGLSPLTLAILLGIGLGNSVPAGATASCATGVGLSKQTLLRSGIVLYGLRLTFGDIGELGAVGLLLDAAMIASTLLLAAWLGRRVLGLDSTSALLIGAGAAICGAAAVLAVATVVRARANDVAVAVATVVAFGTVALLAYPLIHIAVAAGFAGRPGSYGIYIGSTVHEVAQAVAAGSMFDVATSNMAVVAKLGRVAMLAPVLLLISLWQSRKPARIAAAGGDPRPVVQTDAVVIPWFALGFLALAGVNSLGVIPAALHAVAQETGTVCLAMAMAALGLTTRLSMVRAAGRKPVILAAMLAAWLLLGGLAANLVAVGAR
jgi:uncharacterized integral membrane protein (TIGR00698 family)